jgi:transcriptional regulator GlxA family with amidase domain
VLRVQERLRRLAPRMSVVAGGHAASFLMAGADLLHGRVATTAWWLAPEFLRRFPGVTLDMRRRVVDDGKYLTSGAPLAQLDLVLHLVDRLYGPVVAQLVSSHLLADAHGSQNHLAGSGRFAGQHPDVSNAEKWILDNMGRAFTLGELAAAMHTTPRTLSRRFMEEMGTSPYDFIQRLRADRAHHLLRTTRQPLQHIAEQVGYQNAGALRRVFKRFDYPVPSAVRRAGGAHLAPSRSPDLP